MTSSTLCISFVQRVVFVTALAVIFATETSATSFFDTTRNPHINIHLHDQKAYRIRSYPKRSLEVITSLKGGEEVLTSEESENTSGNVGRNARAFLHHRKRTLLPKLREANNMASQKVMHGLNVLQETSTQVAPSVITFLSVLWKSEKGISFFSLYALSLFGASCGFYLFLYFITVGYALGITLPLIISIYLYKLNGSLSTATLIHSCLTVAWGIRMTLFFLWREYVSWPALHRKVLEMQSKLDIPFASRLLCWLVYSFFYVAMLSSNWSRLQSDSPWGILGYTGMIMQVFGLGLETIADMQKNRFKSQNRHSFCNVGVWQWSTHPNYLGEGLFWWGTYIAHGFDSILPSLLASVGLIFVMVVLKGSTRSLSRKHLEKYGDQPQFYEFQRTHSIWGPKKWWEWLQRMEEPLPEQENGMTLLPEDNSTNAKAQVEEATPL